MKICIVQYDDRKDSVLLELAEEMRKYCLLKGLDYIFYDKNPFNIPPYWVKVLLVKEKLKDYDYVIWMDTDVVMNPNATLSFEDIIQENSNYAFIGCNDPPIWKDCSPFMGAVFIVKNSLAGNQIMESWYKCYNSENWIYKNNIWICKGRWAGVDYEQGSFYLCIYQSELSKDIKLLDYSYFHSYLFLIIPENCITIHFARASPAYMKSFLYYKKLLNIIKIRDKLLSLPFLFFQSILNYIYKQIAYFINHVFFAIMFHRRMKKEKLKSYNALKENESLSNSEKNDKLVGE